MFCRGVIMKKKKVTVAVATVVCIIFAATIFVHANPKLRTTLFVHAYHDLMEEGFANHSGVPADEAVLLGYKYMNSWDAEHPMTEFLIMSRGDTYYGCYYSPDGVPLAFQNTDTTLVQNGHNYWEWRAEGDNHGSTSLILGNWYYFEASF